jgi:hypothetical protein
MSERIRQILSVLRREDVALTAIFVFLYAVWIAWPVYGCLPFFGFILVMAYNVSKSHNGLRRLTDKVRDEHPEKLSVMYWDLLRRYGVAIYTPGAAGRIATACNQAKLIGFVVCIILAFTHRWIDVIACFSASMLAFHIERLLAPEIYFDKLARKKVEYASMAAGIRELRQWVQGEEAP